MGKSRNSKIFKTATGESYVVSFTHPDYDTFFLARVKETDPELRPDDYAEVEDLMIEYAMSLPNSLLCLNTNNQSIVVPRSVLEKSTITIHEGDAVKSFI